MNPELDPFFSSLGLFKPILNNLREIVLSCGLIEEVKWKAPCYTYRGKNIIVLGEFKDNCVLSFLWHNNQITEYVHHESANTYKSLLELLKHQQLRFTLPGDLYDQYA